MTRKMDPFIKIATIGNLIEAQVLASVLEQRAIPHRIRSFHDTAYDGLFQFQKGWGEIYAPVEYRADILQILESADNEGLDNSGDETED